jgi:OOP family OmpA-OmpF porin
VNAQGCELDSDGDGVVDGLDQCPGTPAGRKVNAQGCELDSDGDGVLDALDKCPGTPAGAKVDAQGCELDSDGDGVVDRLDQCPGTPAGRKVNAQGCEMDGDGDGVVDALDQCPTTPKGDRVDGKGCTLLNTIVLKGVNFDNDKDTLRPDAQTILNEVASTLLRYPAMKVEVGGHTDSRSGLSHNMKLSDRRAKAVMNYFVGKGVAADRLSAKGYGPNQPIADNATSEGRAQNRRVELRILN